MTRHVVSVIGAAVIAVAVVGAVQGQSRDPGRSPDPPSGTGSIRGVVTDQDGQPVRRAIVSVAGDMRLDRSTMTDQEGRYTLTDLPAGRFTVSAEKEGYPRVSHGALRANRPGAGIFLKDGQLASNVNLTLGRGAVMTGVVYDERGEPMPGVPVMAWEVRTSLDGERTLDSGDSATVETDDRGVYRVFGLSPGTYTVGTSWFYHGDRHEVHIPTPAAVRAAFPPPNQLPAPPQARPPSPQTDAPRYNYSPVFSPGVVDPLSADIYTLTPGMVQTGVDLRMQFIATARLTGTIAGPQGTPPARLRLGLARRGTIAALNTTAVRPGFLGTEFSFNSLSPGPYTILAESADDQSGDPLWAQADVVLSAGQTGAVALTLAPAVTIDGQLRFDGDTVPPSDLTRVSILLSRAPSPTPRFRRTTNPDGTLRIAGVIPGSYSLRISVPGGVPPSGPAWILASVVADGHDITDRVLDVPPTGVANLVVTFSDKVSELSGTITSATGEPQSNYFVIAIPADRSYWVRLSRRIVSTRPDGNGRYLFRGLPPGDYLIGVTTDLVARDLQEVSSLEALAAHSVPVTLGLGEQKTLDIRAGTPGGV